MAVMFADFLLTAGNAVEKRRAKFPLGGKKERWNSLN
jgi:hypothetical protein